MYKAGSGRYNETIAGSDEARTSGSSLRPERQSGVGMPQRGKNEKGIRRNYK